MDSEYITALEYGSRHGRTKAWIIKLCHAGRLQGAYLAGGVWVIPADCPLPDPLRRGPKPSFDLALAKMAMERAKVIQRETKAIAREQVAEVGTMLDPACKAEIDHNMAQGGVYDYAGNCKIGNRYPYRPKGWNAAAWLYVQSVLAGKPVLSAPSVKEWPSTAEQFDRKEDIREGVYEKLPLATIKAQVKHWGADEQAYYDSLIAAL
jgi:hypothetical protein